jgi:peptidoglycan hydrolase-like protein with peptidoglycan-binding domain
MDYPNRLIKRGETNTAIVKAIQKRLNQIGCGPLSLDGDFGDKTFQAVKLFQSRFSDTNQNSLKGSIIWNK